MSGLLQTRKKSQEKPKKKPPPKKKRPKSLLQEVGIFLVSTSTNTEFQFNTIYSIFHVGTRPIINKSFKQEIEETPVFSISNICFLTEVTTSDFAKAVISAL